MDEKLIKALTRQMRILNFWVTIYGTIILVVLIFLSVTLFRVVSYVNNLNKKVESSLDVKTKICSNDGSLANILQDRVCK
jgi:hypothetical protein